jgi:phosphoribosyl 1,2-cyclic phosphodiesterase
MSLFITSLNSGSNGNCYYIGNETEAILIDAGISCGEIEKRIKRLGLNIEKVKAVFISHEHSDHINGIQVLSKKHQIPVFITDTTLACCRLKLEKHLVTSFDPHSPVTIGNITVTAFPKHHDAADPYSFIISSSEVKVGVFTDIGVPCKHVIHHFKQCNAAFLETNYDDTMLEKGRYPFYLKNRIRSDKGHLSNQQALDLFTRNRPPFMSHLFLSHISKNNNCPDIVQQLFDTHADGVKMIVASRYQETPVYQISYSHYSLPEPQRLVPTQLSFSF